MSWNVRHEGSPKHVEGLTAEQVLQGLLDGQFEPTDEVQGPGDTEWKALETHPQFAEIAAEIEPPPPPFYDDETRLDMTALIDVCQVLLVFFILTTVYASQELLLEAAETRITDKNEINIRVVAEDTADEAMARMTMTLDPKQPDAIVVTVITNRKKDKKTRFEERITRADIGDKQRFAAFKEKLTDALTPLVEAGFRTLVIEVERKGIPHGLAVTVQDRARAAGMTDVLYLWTGK